MSTNRERVIVAAAFAEEMAADLREIVIQLREHPDDVARAYALAYDFRTEFGKKVVHRLGFGMPRRRKS